MKYMGQKHLWVCLVFILTAMLAVTPVSAQTDDPALYDARKYAEIYGITIEEALQRLTQQATLGELVHILEVNEPDTYAGFWVEHTPVYKMVAAFTCDPTISRELISKYFPESTAAAIEIRQYEFTYVELQEIRSQTVALLKSAGIEISGGGLYVTTNRIKIMVPDIDVFNEAIQTKRLELHRNVDIIEGTIVLAVAEPYTNGMPFLIIIGLFAAILIFMVWRFSRKRQLGHRLER